MVSVRDRKYIKRNVTKEWLKKHKMIYCFDTEETIYNYCFPIIKYKKTTILEGIVCINISDGSILLYVRDLQNNSDYNPFYGAAYGNYKPILEKINKSFIKEFKKLGIEEDNDGK